MQYKQMCSYVKPYKCPMCGAETLFLRVYGRDRLIDYRDIFHNIIGSKNIMNYLASEKIECIKCMSCKRTFLLDNSKIYPVPLTDKDVFTSFGVKL